MFNLLGVYFVDHRLKELCGVVFWRTHGELFGRGCGTLLGSFDILFAAPN